MKSNSPNIILIGFMGSGKTTIGKRLAKDFGFTFIDTDSLIEQQQNTSVSHIFNALGESAFRMLESNLLQEICQNNNQVIATGGGIIKRWENVALLQSSGVVLYLKANQTHILNNLATDHTRPLLENKNKEQEIQTLLCEREPIYTHASHYQIDVSQKTIEQILLACKEILSK